MPRGEAPIATGTRANWNGANPARLTNNTTPDINPDWSADGTRIAFSSFRDGNFEIYVMNANGSGQTRLTNKAGADTQPDLR